MLKVFFTFNAILTLIISLTQFTHASAEGTEEKKIVITSQTLMADTKNNRAIFEGAVSATINNNITIYSDKMVVSYNNSENKITKIHAIGNVRVHKDERAIFSKEATYIGDEEKIIFTGKPKIVEKENVITGKHIIYFFEDDRAIVKGSRVILKNTQ